MSWLNLNESLNSIKGQISSFASNVLADEDEGVGVPNVEVEELRKLCGQQEIEIRKLKAVNEEIRALQNGRYSEDGWVCEIDENEISHLKMRIKELENEKSDLVTQLEQLDIDNQQNVNELIATREKLKEENMELKEKFGKLKQQNITVASREEKLKKELEELKKSLTENNNTTTSDPLIVQNLKSELIDARNELSVLQSTNDTLQKILEETKASYDSEIKEKIKRLESENKIIYSELQKSKEEIKRHEAKTFEDEENCKKLVHILDTYEEKVRILKDELERANRETSNKEEIIEKLKMELEKLTKINGENERTKNDVIQENEELKSKVEENVTVHNDFESLKLKFESISSEKNNLCTELENVKNILEKSNEEMQNLKMQLKEASEINEELKKQLEDFKRKDEKHLETVQHENISLTEELKKIKTTEESINIKLEASLEENRNLLKQLDETRKEHQEYMKNIEQNQKNEELDKLRKENEELLKEKNSIHKTYVNIITENVRKYYVESEDNSVQEIKISEGNPEYQEFNKHFESILKILLDFRNKCEMLERNVYDIQQEKNKILNEKNNEIEKLLQNSELLSQEVISKTETLKEYEKECNDLMKSNEILILELEGFKDNSGLQTISESNEDNMILLESQLETAIRRIKELEKVANSNVQIKINSKNDATKKENTDYHLLLNNFDKLQIDYEINKRDLDRTRLENEELKTTLEKCKTDLENTEYQLEELNINIDEIDGYRKQIDSLVQENNKLKVFSKTDEDLRTELNNFKEKLLLEEDKRKHFEITAKEITEKLSNVQRNEADLKQKCDSLYKELTTLRESKMDIEAKLILENDAKNRIQQKLALHESEEIKLRRIISDLEERLNSEDDSSEKMKMQFEITSLHADLDQSNEKIKTLENQLKDLNKSRTELIQMVTTKHQESLAYHSEIQRLTNVLQEQIKNGCSRDDLAAKNEEIEKLSDQNNFLKEKCEILTNNLLEEQSKIQRLLSEKSEPSEKEIALAKKLERLQSHLIELEEHHTQELLQAEQRNAELQAKANEIEQREKNSSTLYTSVSIRANQQVEGLQNQLQVAVNERNELRKKISDAEDYAKKQGAALANLQFVLEQFRKDKEKDVAKETERIRRQITAEKKVQDDLRNEISNLRAQLEESKQGLQAASRLSDQLENSKKQCASLKDEVQQLRTKLVKSEEDIKQLASQTDGKVDKSLVKNLIIGYVSSNANSPTTKDQQQILKIIATVLDFNQQDHDKVSLNKAHQSSWLGSILSPQGGARGGLSHESLSQAFVRFLENESKPRVVPSLLDAEQPEASKKSTPRQSPIVLSEIVLPTFSDFAQNRNSSSILKDVLKDNS